MTSKEDGGEDAAVGVGNAGSDPGRNDKDSNSGVCNTQLSLSYAANKYFKISWHVATYTLFFAQETQRL